MNNHIKNLILSFACVLIVSCGGSDGEVGGEITELEGRWQGECLNLGGFYNLEENSTSVKIVHEYKGNTFTYYVQTYEDEQCSIFEKEVPASESNLFVDDQSTIATFSIGEEIIAGNGLPAKKIDLHLSEDDIVLNIFQLANNNTELQFGFPCNFIAFPSSGDAGVVIIGSQPQCDNEGRPLDVSSLQTFYKI